MKINFHHKHSYFALFPSHSMSSHKLSLSFTFGTSSTEQVLDSTGAIRQLFKDFYAFYSCQWSGYFEGAANQSQFSFFKFYCLILNNPIGDYFPSISNLWSFIANFPLSPFLLESQAADLRKLQLEIEYEYAKMMDEFIKKIQESGRQTGKYLPYNTPQIHFSFPS